jgi:F-type H+-transporting ATPase subunit a
MGGAGAMTGSPLVLPVMFHVGPVGITTPVVVTWAIMLLLAGGSWMLTRRLSVHPSRMQSALEVLVTAIESQIRDTMRVEPAPFLPLIGTLFIFIFTANWSSLVPGIDPPTAHLETDTALALIVFVAVAWFGIRFRGLRGYVKTFAEPSFLMIPLNAVESLTRTFSLVVRLFGNVMSGVFVIGIVLSLVGLLVPVPLMALDLLTGAVQAYIFSVLAMVFISGGLGDASPGPHRTEDQGRVAPP